MDTPGFQNAATVLNGGNKNAIFNGANFEDLCHNYTQERLQMLFHDRTITTLHENYLREQIDIDGIIGDADLATPAPLVKNCFILSLLSFRINKLIFLNNPNIYIPVIIFCAFE